MQVQVCNTAMMFTAEQVHALLAVKDNESAALVSENARLTKALNAIVKDSTTDVREPPATDVREPQTEPTKTEPTKTEPTKTEPTKTEPTKTEPTTDVGEPQTEPITNIRQPKNASAPPLLVGTYLGRQPKN
jgi:hypothetical protein